MEYNKNSKSIPLTDKLPLYFIIAGLFSILVVGLFAYYSAKEAMLERTFNQLISVRIEKQKRIEKFFDDARSELRMVNYEDLSLFFNKENHGGSEISEINDFSSLSLFKYGNKAETFSKAYLIKEDELIEIDNLSGNSTRYSLYDRPEINKIKEYIPEEKTNDLNVHNYTITEDDSFIFMGLNYYGSDKKLYEIILQINQSTIDNIMLENNPHNGLGNSGEAYLVGDDFFLRSKSRFIDKSVRIVKVETQGVRNAISNLTGILIFRDYRNIEVLSSYSPLNVPGIKWAILAEIDLKEAMIPIFNLRIKIMASSILIALILLITSFYITNRLTKPLKDLAKKSIEVAKGNFLTVKESAKNDEIGDLTKSFNFMVTELKLKDEALKAEKIKQLRSMLDGQELERQRLSRDLHDGLGQSLFGIKMKIENIFESGKGVFATEKDEILKNIDSTIEEVRRMSNNLKPAVLEDFGIETALKNLCVEIETSNSFSFIYSIEENNLKLSNRSQIYLFRIAQEALNNIVKHARSTNVSMNLYTENNELILSIEDDGVGFDSEKVRLTKGNGIRNLIERVNLLKGKTDINSIPDRGTIITIRIPHNCNS